MDRTIARISRPITACAVMGLFAGTLGCAGFQSQSPSFQPKFATESSPGEVQQKIPLERSEGSLWQENGQMNNLFADSKARQVGDIVTINVVEASSASNEADTNTSKNSTLSAQLSNLLGLENNASFPMSSGFDPFGSVSSSVNNSFQGAGATNRSGKLAASISARVTRVLPNGNLEIIGQREITINSETQIIALTGIIRPRDISTDNVVLSTYISDAKIIYSGSGVVNDRQRPGWFVRVFDTVWPF
jgi:flagellar L-ring protein FlgH